MKDTRKMRIWETAALCALCLTLILGAWAQNRQSTLSSRLLRLHVVADSDLPEEQALKLRVRDAVLAYLEPRLKEAKNAREAEALLRGELEGVRRAAEEATQGRQVRVSLEQEHFPTRNYPGFSLPAGSYQALRVVLGEGEGHNWWCVVFPPLCTELSSDNQLRSAMSRDDLALIRQEEGYELRFRLLELWDSLISRAK